jgi:hypothetical protein
MLNEHKPCHLSCEIIGYAIRGKKVVDETSDEIIAAGKIAMSHSMQLDDASRHYNKLYPDIASLISAYLLIRGMLIAEAPTTATAMVLHHMQKRMSNWDL